MNNDKYVSIQELKNGGYIIFQYGPMGDGNGEGVRPVSIDDLPASEISTGKAEGLSPDEYQKRCLKTASAVSMATKNNLLVQGVMGMCGESGEAIDIVKKHFFQGHPLDPEHLAKELGDVLWYVATTAEAIGYSLEQVMDMNLRKLEKRYGAEFSEEHSMNRQEGDV